jgi:hypothetical protein
LTIGVDAVYVAKRIVERFALGDCSVAGAGGDLRGCESSEPLKPFIAHKLATASSQRGVKCGEAPKEALRRLIDRVRRARLT